MRKVMLDRPAARLNRRRLERRWEMALRELQQAEDALARRCAAAREPEALTPEDRDDFLAIGPQLPELWERPGINREQKKALLRCLIEKVVLKRVVRDRITIRIVWRGGEVSDLDVEPRVHAMCALSRGAEMELRLLELARHCIDDTAIATILTQEGHRSARCSHVPARTVQIVRQRHRVLQDAKSTRARHIAGWLTIAKVAECLQVSDSWIKRRIRAGTIDIHRDPCDKRFLFPDTPASIAALQELKSGARGHLVIAPRAVK